MDAPLVPSGQVTDDTHQFVSEADWIPGFWNYLLDLDRDDLIAELVQNDLDQGATRTIISFEPDYVVCEGNGKPVDANGWERLRIIQGAGNIVPAKRGKIGVKNHGLKVAFTIGDEIRLMSANQAIVQTLYANGRNRPPHPGASRAPLPDTQAPRNGCRIIIRYRKAAIEPPHGEAYVLGVIGAEDIDALFRSACACAPEQFAGIVSPEVAPHYEILLRHWRLGEARFIFSCTRPRNIAKSIELFRRRCNVSGSFSELPDGLQEQAARRLIPLKGRLRQRIADFFRRGNRFFVEVSWPVSGHGKPKTGTGRFRYPIGYPADSHEARTGHGAYFNAPIASDNKRHGPARNEATNNELRAACESLLIDVLARHSVPRWKADGLKPLVPSPGADNQDQAVRPLLAGLAAQGAMPTLNWTAATKVLQPRNRRASPAIRRISTGRRSAEVRRYRFVVPITTWESDAINPTVSIVSPRTELQLDPRTHPAIIDLLTDQQTDGFGEVFVTFDEDDAFCRVAGDGNMYFDALSDPAVEFAHPSIAHAYLDLIHSALDNNSCDVKTEGALQEALLLPELSGQPVPFRALHSSVLLPSDVPGLKFPPILHRALAGHPLFKHRRKWQRPRYTMVSFLESGALQNADEHTRRLFWKWLRRNERLTAPRDRPKLADIPIWPDNKGRLCTLATLCNPRSQLVAGVLREFIRQPHDQVRRSRLVSGGTAIRRTPTEQEVTDWLNSRLAHFPLGITPDERIVSALGKFEADLVALLRDAGAARALKTVDVRLPALAQDGSIRERAKLVSPSRAVEQLALPPRFLLRHKKRAAVLDRLSRVLSAPTVAMLLDAFVEDGTNFAVLQPRLHQFISLTEPGDDDRRQLADLPIIPVNGRPLPPSTVAFTGSKGDYWGAWKKRISGKGLSQEDQRRYRAAGVTSALPDGETSRAFFEWLSEQDESVLQCHIPCILRHILHRNGPAYWADIFTDIPFIPARGHDGLRLVSLRGAKHRPVYLPDAEDLADAIVQRDPGVLLVIDHVKEVAQPIREPLRNLGIRSLREALKEPESVSGHGETATAAHDVVERLSALRSPHFHRTFLKRLSTLGVEPDLVWRDWHDRLSRVRTVRFAETVEALYRFRRALYPVQVDGGFDPGSGTFWMNGNRRIGLSSLYEAIAAQLVFKPAARPVHCLALERALELEIRDPSYGRPDDATYDPKDEKPVAETDGVEAWRESEGEGCDDDADPGEAVFGHSPFEPDPSRNAPNPGPISSSPKAPSRRHWRVDGASGGSARKAETKPAPELEQEHIEALKRGHYASHCQMCLCERTPRVLAPPGSYIQWEEVRRRVVEAHHVDLKSAGGARHPGNLILLCKFHHDNYGRRLTRAAITQALQDDTVDKVIRFGVDGEAVTEVKGRQIDLVIPDTGEVVKIFFTAQHSNYWVSQARPLDEAPEIGLAHPV